MNSFQQNIQAMEAALSLQADGTNVKGHLDDALKFLKQAIKEACGISIDLTSTHLSDLLNDAIKNNKGRREAAILIVRALSVEGLLPFESDHLLERKIAELVETGFEDQSRSLKLSEKRQTFEKINALKGLHESICANLQVLKKLPSTLDEIDSIKVDIKRALNHSQCSAYLQPYNWTAIKGKIGIICEQITDLVACKDTSYKARFDQFVELCGELKELANSSPSFLNQKYIVPFSEAIDYALHTVKVGVVDQFSCMVEPRRKPPNVAEKRYPLHQEGKLLTITIPFVNNGPGIAIDVTVELDCGKSNSIALDNGEIHLGDIPPGEFAVSFEAMVIKPSRTVDMAIQVSWNQLFSVSQSIAFDAQLTGQDPSVDWGKLEKLDPYSLEVAEGDKFVGRKAKVQAIGNRLLKSQMSSTYITGQKRIGKTSLAQAVLRYVSANAMPPVTYETCYIEWGEYCAADAAGTVKALGELIYGFLRSHLVQGVDMQTPAFDGSLAPLNAIAKLLESTCPNKRFVIVLDEFDEIHPEMYRYGALAEAFFANLRTLGARKNLAFILVGGEKMPFIIGAQGDQLNKFGREPLDYFSRSDEWADYVELVTGPVKNSLNWEESALNELFFITNGHPYYTKLLCSKVFSTAVAQRDTEIIASDIRHALNGRVSELDTNAFAHFWKDGINAERIEAEIIELKRLRVLVAIGRSLRLGALTKLTISENISSALPQNEVGPIVDDFCRRDIMKEVGRDIAMQLPIFQRWVQDVGVSKLISSTLADELENGLRKANDEAYVASGEIEALVKQWPLYRGHEVTGESVRAWLNQVNDVQEQRMIFTILQNLRFVNKVQISELLHYAHERIVARATPPRMRDSKVEKRRDILVTYMGGPGKSGTTYARDYAKENDLLMDCIVEPSKVARRLLMEEDPPNAVVIVDDLAGTGTTITGSLQSLLSEIGPSLTSRNIPLFLIVLFATEDAERKIRSTLTKFSDVTSQLHVCEILTNKDRAFPNNEVGFWKDDHMRDRAKALTVKLGTGLYKDPLGFGSQSLLIAFPETCPNNNLPIIFSSRSGKTPWNALLLRPTS